MDLYGKHFIFAGISSSTYGLVISSITSTVNTAVMGSPNDSEFYGKKNIHKYLLGTDWESSPLSFSVEITRSSPFELSDLRTVERWLFRKTGYNKLYIDPDDDAGGETSETIDGNVKRLYLNCRLLNPQKIMMSGGVVGFTCTISCDSAFAWQDEITKTFPLTSASTGESFAVTTSFDYPGYIYPRVVIQAGSTGGTIILANNTDSATRLTKFVGISANQQIVMNGAVNYVNGNNYSKFDGAHFIRLLDGSNTISVTGDVTSVTLTWSNVRYL